MHYTYIGTLKISDFYVDIFFFRYLIKNIILNDIILGFNKKKSNLNFGDLIFYE